MFVSDISSEFWLIDGWNKMSAKADRVNSGWLHSEYTIIQACVNISGQEKVPIIIIYFYCD